MIRKKSVWILCIFFIIILTHFSFFAESETILYNPLHHINTDNSPPNPPEITGLTSIITGELYNYSIVSIDPDGDNVSYYIEFGTGDFIFTRDWYPSGEPIKVNYIWRETGTFTMRARAQDIYYAQSDWGTLEITISDDDDAPEIKIVKPENALYMFDNKIRNFYFRKPLIIGSLNIEANILNDASRINKVEFYIDDELKASITSSPYIYQWIKEKIITFKHRHLIKVIAYDNYGNTKTDEIIVWKFL